jgi:hypothetical protein
LPEVGDNENKLLSWMKHFLQEGGGPCHKSKKEKAFLKEIAIIDWPGNSLDLNPIENLWAIMESKLKQDPAITSLPLLIKEMWVTLPKPLMFKLAHSMPLRIKKCKENGSQMTK